MKSARTGDVAQWESIAFATRGSGVRIPPSPCGRRDGTKPTNRQSVRFGLTGGVIQQGGSGRAVSIWVRAGALAKVLPPPVSWTFSFGKATRLFGQTDSVGLRSFFDNQAAARVANTSNWPGLGASLASAGQFCAISQQSPRRRRSLLRPPQCRWPVVWKLMPTDSDAWETGGWWRAGSMRPSY